MRAFNLYHSPEGDLALREDVLRQHLPQVGFVDHSPQQLPHDEEMDLPPAELLRGLPLHHTHEEIEEVLAHADHHEIKNLVIQEEDEEASQELEAESEHVPHEMSRLVSFATNSHEGSLVEASY